MSAWDSYEALAEVRGETKRGITKRRESKYITNHIIDSLSYFSVTIDGTAQNVAIVNTDNLDQKLIYSMPGGDLRHGGLVNWKNCMWIINEKDANTEIYARGKLLQCNYKLKWVDSSGVLREQWCNVEDGTKYLTGDYEDREFIVTRGDARIAVTVPRNEHTKKLGRDMRFLIDDINGGNEMMSFKLSKPLKVGHSYDSQNGVYKFVMHEDNSTEYDNFVLGVADYYKYFPRTGEESVESNITPGDITDSATGRKKWI